MKGDCSAQVLPAAEVAIEVLWTEPGFLAMNADVDLGIEDATRPVDYVNSHAGTPSWY